MTDKQDLRRHLRARRDAFVAHGKPGIAHPKAYIARLAPGTVVASYAPVGSEADPAPFAEAARAAGCTLALPHVVDRATPLRFLVWEGTALAPGPFGLRQPPADAPAVAPDIVLTPLVGFDPARNRLGQGAGHYDRAFAAHPGAWRLGIAFSVQRVDSLAADPWDMPLDLIVTEDGEW